MVRCFRKGVKFFGIMRRPARGALVRKDRKTETLQDKSGYLTERVSPDPKCISQLAQVISLSRLYQYYSVLSKKANSIWPIIPCHTPVPTGSNARPRAHMHDPTLSVPARNVPCSAKLQNNRSPDMGHKTRTIVNQSRYDTVSDR
jgi:hypothetical protein